MPGSYMNNTTLRELKRSNCLNNSELCLYLPLESQLFPFFEVIWCEIFGLLKQSAQEKKEQS